MGVSQEDHSGPSHIRGQSGGGGSPRRLVCHTQTWAGVPTVVLRHFGKVILTPGGLSFIACKMGTIEALGHEAVVSAAMDLML